MLSSPVYNRPLPRHYKHGHLFVIWRRDKGNERGRRPPPSFKRGHLLHPRSPITELCAAVRNRRDTCLPGETVWIRGLSRRQRPEEERRTIACMEMGSGTIGSIQIQSAHTKRRCHRGARTDWRIERCCLFRGGVSITLLAVSAELLSAHRSDKEWELRGSSARADVRQERPRRSSRSFSISFFVSPQSTD